MKFKYKSIAEMGLRILFLQRLLPVAYAFNDNLGNGKKIPKIAVIGGGIGGTSAAYFLHDLFGDDLLLDIYEAGTIGGRLATVPIGEKNYEVGGSIIHPKNMYMVNFIKQLGLKKRGECSGGSMGIYDGNEYVFRDSSWSIVSLARLFYRYGWDVYRLNSLTNDMLDNFSRIYTLQDDGNAYRNVESMLEAMDPKFNEMRHFSTSDWLSKLGFHHRMIDELVTAATRTNYGQSTALQAFCGSIAVAGASPDLWAVEGGNKRVPEELQIQSRASLLHRIVTEVTPGSEGGFTVTSVEDDEIKNHLFEEGHVDGMSIEDDTSARKHDYDIVVIATPLTEDKRTLKLKNFTKDFNFPGHYERILATMVHGKIRPESLKFTSKDPLDEILATTSKLIFNSIGKQNPVDGECLENIDIWKVFSPKPLTEEQLNYFFEERNSTTVIDWLAYPHYDSDQSLGEFELQPGLYYVNAIEFAGSAMEMSAIGGKNAALLAYKFWLEDKEAGRKKRPKEEL